MHILKERAPTYASDSIVVSERQLKDWENRENV